MERESSEKETHKIGPILLYKPYYKSLSFLSWKQSRKASLEDLIERCSDSSTEEIIIVSSRREDFAISVYNNPVLMKRIKERDEWLELFVNILKSHEKYREQQEEQRKLELRESGFC